MRIFRDVFGTSANSDENVGLLDDEAPISSHCATNVSLAIASTSQSVDAKLIRPNPSGKENAPNKKVPKSMSPFVRLKLLKPKSFNGTAESTAENIARDPLSVVVSDQQHGGKVQRPIRNVQPVTRLNYSIVECCVCQKTIHIQDNSAHCADGNIICSSKCFKNA